LKEIALPRQVFSHGFIYKKKGNELVRESKTDAEANLGVLVEEFGSEAYRYYFMAKCAFGGDGEYSFDHMKEVYNADLANNLGNFVNRSLNMMIKYGEGVIPAGPTKQEWFKPDQIHTFRDDMGEFNYKGALTTIWNILHRANEFIENSKPWALAKTDVPACLDVMRELASALRIVSLLLKPFMPGTAAKIAVSLGLKDWPQATFGIVAEIAHGYGNGVGEIKVKALEPLFPRKAKS
jgi:methionyl-tRNA synthetase